jgi:hypothetical protein
MAKSRRRVEEETRTPSNASAQNDTAAPELDRERVAQRAYELYLSRGGRDGQDQDDWLVAEQELIRNRRRSEES